MAVATFDTLKFANALKAVSEALATNFKDLVTKDDLRALKEELTSQIRESEQRLNAKIDTSSAKNTGEMTLIKWMLGVSISLSVTLLIRLFFMPK